MLLEVLSKKSEKMMCKVWLKMYKKSLQKHMGCCNIDFALSFVCMWYLVTRI
jgi:hypothetical protein